MGAHVQVGGSVCLYSQAEPFTVAGTERAYPCTWASTPAGAPVPRHRCRRAARHRGGCQPAGLRPAASTVAGSRHRLWFPAGLPAAKGLASSQGLAGCQGLASPSCSAGGWSQAPSPLPESLWPARPCPAVAAGGEAVEEKQAGRQGVGSWAGARAGEWVRRPCGGRAGGSWRHPSAAAAHVVSGCGSQQQPVLPLRPAAANVLPAHLPGPRHPPAAPESCLRLARG